MLFCDDNYIISFGKKFPLTGSRVVVESNKVKEKHRGIVCVLLLKRRGVPQFIIDSACFFVFFYTE